MLGRYHRDRLIRAQPILVEQNLGIRETIETAAVVLGIADRVHVQLRADNGISGASV